MIPIVKIRRKKVKNTSGEIRTEILFFIEIRTKEDTADRFCDRKVFLWN